MSPIPARWSGRQALSKPQANTPEQSEDGGAGGVETGVQRFMRPFLEDPNLRVVVFAAVGIIVTFGAWAVAPSAAVSDALATSFMILSTGEVADFCRAHLDVAAMLLVEAPGGHALLRFGDNLDFRESQAG